MGCLWQKKRNKGWVEYAGTICHIKNILNISKPMPQMCNYLGSIEESRDGPSNTNTMCHHRNKEQSEQSESFDTNV